MPASADKSQTSPKYECVLSGINSSVSDVTDSIPEFDYEKHEGKLNERMCHLSDTYSEYLLYLIQSKGLENADVYKRAIVGKKIFSKLKNNRDYHPNKLTALCLCLGAKLNKDETVVVLGRQRIDSHISVDLDVKKHGITSGNATYDDIKAYVREKYGFEVHSAYIGQVKEKLGIRERKNYNVGSGKHPMPLCPPEKEEAIKDALRHFGLI